MGLADYSYYLRAESGDTTPHDELGVSGNLSGGTITLQDLGGGDFSWRVAGVSSVDVPNHEVKGNVAASGVTIAMRIAIPTMGTGDFDVLVNYAIALGQSHGFRLGKSGSNLNVQFFDPDNGTMAQTASFSIGSTLRTLVMRLSIGLDSGADVSQVWLSGLGSVGTDPDYDSGPGNLSNSARTLAYIVVGGDDEVIDVLDLVVWPEELPDADCAALRDNGIRTTLDALASGPTIDTHPSNATVTEGATANFTVAATTSGGTLTYQWQVDTGGGWANVSTGTGGTTDDYTTATTTTGMSGYQFRCVVTDDNGSVNSNAATLTVNAAATPPDAPTAGSASSVTHNSATANWTDNSDDETGFKVEYGVSSSGTVSSWSAASGSPAAANATSLALTGLTPETTYKFRVAASNAEGDSSWSESAEFTTEAAPVTAVKGVRVQLSAGAESLTGLSVRWWDDPTATGAPDYSVDNETTDSSRWLEIDLDSVTALAMDGVGYLLVFKAGANPDDDMVAAGRVPIVDISE